MDRAVATNEWLSIFLGTKFHHIDVTFFDRKPLWIVPDGMDYIFQKPFRFEQMWMLDKGCNDTIEVEWKERINELSTTQVLQKVDRCREELTWWSRKCFGSVHRGLERKKKQLQWVENIARQGGDIG